MAATKTPKLSKNQTRLLDLMAKGWTATIFFDDPRTRYTGPALGAGIMPRGERGRETTVVALFSRGLIKIRQIHTNPHSERTEAIVYEIA